MWEAMPGSKQDMINKKIELNKTFKTAQISYIVI